MVLEIIGDLIVVIVIGLVAGFIAKVLGDLRNNDKISFKESMDLTELPVVTFINEGKKLNFLLDTGSNLSIINASVLPNIVYKKIEDTIDTIGLGGTIQSERCNINIQYKNKDFVDTFTIADMDEQFNLIKQQDGVTIHGILGSKFLEKYKYVLDFKNLVAYIK